MARLVPLADPPHAADAKQLELEDATNLDIVVLPEETVSVTGRVVDASGKPAIYILPDSPRHSEDVEVHAPGLTLRAVLRQP